MRIETGAALCLLSAASFGTMAILAKVAYAAGVGIEPLLAGRFLIAAVLLWGLVLVRREPLAGSVPALGLGFLLGAVGYATQAGLFFSALERIDAGLTSLLLYAYPAFVVLAAFALGRERPDRRRVGALLIASSGLVLVLGGIGAGANLVGAGMALGAGAAYSAYILISDGLTRRLRPLPFAAAVCSGAATTFTVVGAASGTLRLDLGWAGWGAIVAMALLCTVVANATFFAGLERVGPSRAAILSTVEPPVTVLLALVAFGETLGAAQLLGGVLVLCAAVLVVRRVAETAEPLLEPA